MIEGSFLFLAGEARPLLGGERGEKVLRGEQKHLADFARRARGAAQGCSRSFSVRGGKLPARRGTACEAPSSLTRYYATRSAVRRGRKGRSRDPSKCLRLSGFVFLYM